MEDYKCVFEEVRNGRRERSFGRAHTWLGLDGVLWWDSIRGCYNSINRWCKLSFFIFLIFYSVDVVLTVIGLRMGLWQHYNPWGIQVYQVFSIFGFLFYRLLILFVITVFFLFFIRYRMRVYNGVYIFMMLFTYSSAIIWDLQSLGYPQIFNLVPDFILEGVGGIFSLVFKLVGVS